MVKGNIGDLLYPLNQWYCYNLDENCSDNLGSEPCLVEIISKPFIRNMGIDYEMIEVKYNNKKYLVMNMFTKEYPSPIYIVDYPNIINTRNQHREIDPELVKKFGKIEWKGDEKVVIAPRSGVGKSNMLINNFLDHMFKKWNLGEDI